MTIAFQQFPEPNVYVADGSLHITEFTETDPDVVSAVEQGDDPSQSVRTLLRLGAQSVKLANTRLDADVLGATVEKLTKNVEGSVGSAVENLQATAKHLLDGDSGTIPSAFKGFKSDLERMLGDKFDPDSKKGILNQFEKVLAEGGQAQAAKIGRLLDPTSPDSPLNRWRDEIVKVVKAETEDVAKQVHELGERIAGATAGQAAEKAMFNKTTLKGTKFEDVLHEVIESIAHGHCDVAVQTGHETGADGTRKGDEVVTLDPDGTRGVLVNVVYEVKDKKVGVRKILEELDLAMSNRQATVGIAVFGSEEHAPTKIPFTQYGTKAILVIDKDEPDPGLVRLAYLWSSWVAKRHLTESDEDTVDLGRIESLVEEARRALQRITTIKRSHSTARKSIDEAGGQLDSLQTEVASVLDQLESEIDTAA